jgi:hypothetical protein
MMRGTTNATQLSGDLLESSVNENNGPQASDKTLSFHMRSEVFMAVKMSMLVFWVVMPCGLVGRYSAEDGGSMFLHEVGIYLQDHTPLQPRRPTLTVSSLLISFRKWCSASKMIWRSNV